jgi:hypothetical protein
MPNAPLQIDRDYVHPACGSEIRLSFRQSRVVAQGGKPFGLECPACGSIMSAALAVKPDPVEPLPALPEHHEES